MRPPDNTSLRTTLYLIEYERSLRMKELDIERRQFVLRRRDSVQRKTSSHQEYEQRREELMKRIQRGKDAEADHQISLLKRKEDLIEKLKAREKAFIKRQSRHSKMFIFDDDDDIEMKNEIQGSQQCNVNNQNKIANLYQRGFALLKKRKESSRNQFIASVNTIIEKLRPHGENPDKNEDPFNALRKSIMKNFVDNNEAQKNIDDSQVVTDNVDSKLDTDGEKSRSAETNTDAVSDEKIFGKCKKAFHNKDGSVDDEDNNDNAQTIDESDKQNVVNKKSPSNGSCRALNLWAKLQMEQQSIRNWDKREQQGIRNWDKKEHKMTSTSPDRSIKDEKRNKNRIIDDSYHSSKYVTNDSPSKKRHLTNNSRKSSKMNNTLDHLPNTKSPKSLMARRENNSPEKKKSKSQKDTAPQLMSSPENKKSKSQNDTAPQLMSSPNDVSSPDCVTKKSKIPQLTIESCEDKYGNGRKSLTLLTDECIEECDETTTPNTISVMHNEDDDESMSPPKDWYQKYRYSLSPKDNELLPTDYFQESESVTQQNERSNDPEISITTSETDKPAPLSPIDNDINQTFTQTDPPERSELDSPCSQDSDLLESMRTLSEIPSYGRSSTRQGRSGKRRLSMQTRGSLRALSDAIKSQQEIQDENLHPESTSYRAVFEALVGAAADADALTQRLENIRQAGSGIRPVDNGVKISEQMHSRLSKDIRNNVAYRGRRSTIEAPSYSTAADVTDPVYKFLQHRNQSKTMRRFKTLSDVELKLLAHAPGEDIRRHSFSSQQSRRRSSSSNSSSIANGDISRKMSVTSATGSRKTSGELSVVFESESGQSRSVSRIGSASTRPNSVSVSEHSRTESRSSFLSALPKQSRSYSWAPDVSETKGWHVLAMELLARQYNGPSKFRSVSHMLKWLGDEYRQQTASMMYEELRYCSYLRLPKHQQPAEFAKYDIDASLTSRSPSP